MALTSPRFASNQRLQRAAQNNPAMRQGESGEAVRLLQQGLIDLGFAMPITIRRYGTPDGIFGNETATRMREFQSKNKLSPDGVAGNYTCHRFDELFKGQPAPKMPPLPTPGKFNHKVRLHLRTISMPNVSEFKALEIAQRIYAQYSIGIEMASGMSLMLSNAEVLKLKVVDGNCKWDQVSDEQRLLQGKGRDGVGPNDIVVYFATTLREVDGSELQGCAGHAPGRPACMVAADAIDPTTMAHEVGHVLLGSSFAPVHVGDSNNLMCSAAVCTGNPATLTDDQLAAIRKSPFCVKQF